MDLASSVSAMEGMGDSVRAACAVCRSCFRWARSALRSEISRARASCLRVASTAAAWRLVFSWRSSFTVAERLSKRLWSSLRALTWSCSCCLVVSIMAPRWVSRLAWVALKFTSSISDLWRAVRRETMV